LVVVIVAYALEQARLARWRRIVTLPRPPNPNLRVLLPDTASVSAGIGATFAAATHPAIAHISRICKPIAWVVLLLLQQLERASFHSFPIPVARALADVYRRARAPAVAEGFFVFPVARGAGAHGRHGGV
jgi:hypothetical protein